MRTRLIAFMIALLFIALQTANSQPKALLRLHLEKGAEYHMTMVSDNNIDQQMNGQQMKILQKMEMVTSYKVLDILPDNNYFLGYTFLKMKMDMDVNGQKVIMDTESTSDDPVTKAVKDLTSFNMKITVTPMGKVMAVEGMDEFAAKIGNNPQLSQALGMLSNADNFKATFEQYFGFYPENEVEVGSKWDNSIKMPAMMNMEMLMHMTVTDIKNDQVVMDVTSDINMDSPVETNGMKIHMKMTGTQTGTMRIDRKSGLTGTADMNQKFDMHMKFQNPQTGEDMEMPMQMNGVSKISTVKI